MFLPLRFKNRIFAAVGLLVFSGCTGKHTDAPSYTVIGHVDGGNPPAVAYLYKFLPEYGKTTLLDSVAVGGGQFRFTGSCGDPAEAFVRLKGNPAVYPLVLSDNTLTLHIGADYYVLSGSPENRKLSALYAKRTELERRRQNRQTAVRKLERDSALTKELNDSLLRIGQEELEDFRQEVVRAVSADCGRYPLSCRTAFRELQKYLTLSQADSLRRLLNPVDR